MAYDSEDVPNDWDEKEYDLYDDVFGGERDIMDDPHMMMDFHFALFDQTLDAETRSMFYQDLLDYSFNEYGIDFEYDFDWDGYRDWYDSQ